MVDRALCVRSLTLGSVAFQLILLASGCATTVQEKALSGVAIPVRDTEAKPPQDDDPRENPPESEPTREFVFPKVTRAELSNGLALGVVSVKDSPLVYVRFVLKGAGSSADGDRTGTATLAAQWLVEGGAMKMAPKDLHEKLGALGAKLTVVTTPDASTLDVSVTKDKWTDVVELIGSLLKEPRFDEAEFTKLKRRASQQRQQLAVGDDSWAAKMLLVRELFKLPTSLHPYSSFDATSDEIEKLTSAEVKTFAKKWFSPQATAVVVVGAVEGLDAHRSIEKSLGLWKGPTAASVGIGGVSPPEGDRIYVADRPGASQSTILVATIGPEQESDKWPAVAAGWQILAGGKGGRLERELREKKGLLLSAQQIRMDVALGKQPLVLSAECATNKTGKAIESILEQLHRATDQAPKDDDVTAARRKLSDELAIAWGAPSGVADGLAQLVALNRADDFPAQLVQMLTKVDSFAVGREMGKLTGHVIVVVGDAQRIGTALSKFGEVAVVNPTKGFERTKSIHANEKASLEIGEKQ